MDKGKENKQKKMVKIIFAILILIILISIFYTPKADATEELAKCIGLKSVLYTQLGCSACVRQEQIFGESYKDLNVIDCFYELDKCGGIEATPTWIIGGQKYTGIQELSKLKQLTGC